MNNQNSKPALTEWAITTVNKAEDKINIVDRISLIEIAKATIKKGGWRGEISDAWKQYCLDNDVDYHLIPDLYL